MNGLPLALPIAFITRNVEQVLVGIDVLAPHEFRGVGNHILGNAYLAGNLDSKAAARVAYLQLEERRHLLPVVEHSAVHDAWCILGKMLEVLVVCRDDAEGSFLDKTLQYGFGNRAADSWLCSAAELVY